MTQQLVLGPLPENRFCAHSGFPQKLRTQHAYFHSGILEQYVLNSIASRRSLLAIDLVKTVGDTDNYSYC